MTIGVLCCSVQKSRARSRMRNPSIQANTSSMVVEFGFHAALFIVCFFTAQQYTRTFLWPERYDTHLVNPVLSVNNPMGPIVTCRGRFAASGLNCLSFRSATGVLYIGLRAVISASACMQPSSCNNRPRIAASKFNSDCRDILSYNFGV